MTFVEVGPIGVWARNSAEPLGPEFIGKDLCEGMEKQGSAPGWVN